MLPGSVPSYLILWHGLEILQTSRNGNSTAALASPFQNSTFSWLGIHFQCLIYFFFFSVLQTYDFLSFLLLTQKAQYSFPPWSSLLCVWIQLLCLSQVSLLGSMIAGSRLLFPVYCPSSYQISDWERKIYEVLQTIKHGWAPKTGANPCSCWGL